MKNIGIILAGGSGLRMGKELPKQFLLLESKTILEHSLTAFQNNRYIDEIFVVTNPQYLTETENLLKHSPYPKVSRILCGGKERYHSTLAALEACPETGCNLIIHDAVRPLVQDQMITNCIEALKTFTACTTAIPATDTIIVSNPSHDAVREIPDRQYLYQVQTPQAFHKTTLVEAYHRALQSPEFHPTDDCSVVKKYLSEQTIKLLPGSPSNLKITYPEDLLTAGKLLTTALRANHPSKKQS